LSREKIGIPKPLGLGGIERGKHLMRTNQQLFLAIGHRAVEDSVILTTQLPNCLTQFPDGRIIQYWGSFPSSDHSREIDGYKDTKKTDGYCPYVQFTISDASWENNITLFGKAQRVRDPRTNVILARMNKARLRTGSPEVKLGSGQVLYEAEIFGAGMPVPYCMDEERTDEGHEPIDIALLIGFHEQK
jgi:hypothetical protein